MEQPTARDQSHDDTLQAFKAVIATGAGKRVLFWILEQAGIYRDPFGGTDQATNYTLGQQSIGRKVMGMLDQIDPRAYPQLLIDVADERVMEQAARAAAKQQEDDDEQAP